MAGVPQGREYPIKQRADKSPAKLENSGNRQDLLPEASAWFWGYELRFFRNLYCRLFLIGRGKFSCAGGCFSYLRPYQGLDDFYCKKDNYNRKNAGKKNLYLEKEGPAFQQFLFLCQLIALSLNK